MPDKWEYPFFAAWDTAFHCIPLAMIDPAFAKKQLDLLTREWYMKPDGQIPAYEWNFSDVNPPVHAWATFRVFKLERKLFGKEDVQFLERVFQKLLLNFTYATIIRTPWQLNTSIDEIFWIDGGSIGRTRADTMSSRAASLAWTTLVPSIARSLCQLVVSFARPMGPLGWPSSA
jgi:hypothetical protein